LSPVSVHSAGLPIVATDTLDFHTCGFHPTNSTEETITVNANHTDTTTINIDYERIVLYIPMICLGD